MSEYRIVDPSVAHELAIREQEDRDTADRGFALILGFEWLGVEKYRRAIRIIAKYDRLLNRRERRQKAKQAKQVVSL